MDGFLSTYVSNITSYVAYMECDDNFEKSLVSMKNESVMCGEIRFTCKSSIVAFSNARLRTLFCQVQKRAPTGQQHNYS